jgi:hypothetical protein
MTSFIHPLGGFPLSLYSIAPVLVLDGRAAHISQQFAMRREFHIDKLSDEFVQYTSRLKCSACGHERTAEPHTLGRLCGWDALLDDLAKRMRCSKCGKKQCTLRAVPPSKPRGYSALGR